MDSSSIDLPGSEIDTISFDNGALRIHFTKALITKTMTGSIERTSWWQTGDLIFTDAELIDAELIDVLPSGSLICTGGDIIDNFYTFRDMLPIPFEGRGKIHCLLRFQNHQQVLRATAQTVHLKLVGVAKYIEHIRPDKQP